MPSSERSQIFKASEEGPEALQAFVQQQLGRSPQERERRLESTLLLQDVKNAHAQARNLLLRYIISLFATQQRLANKTGRLVLDFSAPVPAAPPAPARPVDFPPRQDWQAYWAQQWQTSWQQLQVMHPFGIEVLLTDTESHVDPDINYFLELRTSSVHHAMSILLKTENPVYQTIYQTLRRRIVELEQRLDLPYNIKLELAKELISTYINDCCIVVARQFYELEEGKEPSVKHLEHMLKLLGATEQRHPSPAVRRDALVLRFGGKELSEGLRAASTINAEFCRRHYRRTAEQKRIIAEARLRERAADERLREEEEPVPSASAHDPEGYDLANFGLLEQMQVALTPVTGGFTFSSRVTQVTARTGTFSPLKNKTLSAHQKCLWAYRKMIQLLTEDAQEAVASGRQPQDITHVHVHLISGSMLGGLFDSQYKQFMYSRIAAYRLLPVNLYRHGDRPESVRVGERDIEPNFLYCCFGVNSLRGMQSTEQYGVNAMTMIHLYEKYIELMKNPQGKLPQGFLSIKKILQAERLGADESEEYKTALRALKAAALDYLRLVENGAASKELDRALKDVKAKERVVHIKAITIANAIKKQVCDNVAIKAAVAGEPPAIPAPEDRAGWFVYNRYYATQCMYLIQQLMPHVNHVNAGLFGFSFRNIFKESHTSDSRNGLIQALIPMLTNAMGVFSSYGCKSANDRAVFVALIVQALSERMAARGKIVEEDIAAIYEQVKCNYPHSLTQWHSQFDLRGGFQKFADSEHITKARGYEARKELSGEAPHMKKMVFKVRLSLDKAHYADSAFYKTNFKTKLPEAIRKAYKGKGEKFSLRNLFVTHNRHQQLESFLAKLTDCDEFDQAARLLWLQYKALKTGLLKDILLGVLKQCVEDHYGGLCCRGNSTEAIIKDALIGNCVLTTNGLAYELEKCQDLELKGKIIKFNLLIEKAMQALLQNIEQHRNSPGMDDAISRSYQMLFKINKLLVIKSTPEEDLEVLFEHRLQQARELNLSSPVVQEFTDYLAEIDRGPSEAPSLPHP